MCVTGEELETDGTSNDQLLPKVQRSKRFIWLLLVVNGAILVIALMIAGLCCRRASGGGTGTSRPYSYIGLPAGISNVLIGLDVILCQCRTNTTRSHPVVSRSQSPKVFANLNTYFVCNHCIFTCLLYTSPSPRD